MGGSGFPGNSGNSKFEKKFEVFFFVNKTIVATRNLQGDSSVKTRKMNLSNFEEVLTPFSRFSMRYVFIDCA